jgi:hypothetical protein
LSTSRHVIEPSQPDKLIRVIKIIKLSDDLNPHNLLRLDKFALKEPDQFITPAWMESVHSQLDDWGIDLSVHVRSNSMTQLVSQVLPPSIEKACSH